MNGMDKADARARLNAPADGWALGIRWLLSAALAAAALADGRRRRRTRRGIEVAHPPGAGNAIGHLRSREITVTCHPRAKTLQADTPEAVTTVIGRAS
jgi:hypothetical protein